MGHNLLLPLFILVVRLPLIWLTRVLKLACVILISSPHFFKVFFSAKQDVPGLSCIFPDPALELVMSPKNAGPF